MTNLELNKEIERCFEINIDLTRAILIETNIKSESFTIIKENHALFNDLIFLLKHATICRRNSNISCVDFDTIISPFEAKGFRYMDLKKNVVNEITPRTFKLEFSRMYSKISRVLQNNDFYIMFDKKRLSSTRIKAINPKVLENLINNATKLNKLLNINKKKIKEFDI